MSKLKIKIDWEFVIDLSTKRETCTACNGTGQVKVDDPDIKRDGCDECVASGSFDAQIENCLTDTGNQFFLEKYMSNDDFEKMFLVSKLIDIRQRHHNTYEAKAYQDEPKFLKIERTK